MHALRIERGAAPAHFVSSWKPVLLLIVFLVTASCRAAHQEPAAAHGGEELEAPRHQEGIVVLSDEKLRGMQLETARAEHRRLAPQIETTGVVGFEEDRRAHVSPRLPGRVVEVRASLGDEVHEGDVLVVLDSVALGQARAAHVMAMAREAVSRDLFEREQTLFESGISAQRELIEARAEYRIAHAERQQAQETLRLYGLSSSAISALTREVPGTSTTTQEVPGTSTTGTSTTTQEVPGTSLESTHEVPGTSLLELTAPIDGTIVEKHATLGELATDEKSLFTIADLRRVWIWIDVFERQLANVHLGDDVEVEVESLTDRTFSGKVTYLAPEVHAETRTVRARIDVDNAQRHLRPGMFATVRLVDPHAEVATRSVVVPAAAVQRRGDESLVFVPRATGQSTAQSTAQFEAREVEIGRQEGGWIEVLGGLEPGEEVITTGSFLLKSELAREELGGGHSH